MLNFNQDWQDCIIIFNLQCYFGVRYSVSDAPRAALGPYLRNFELQIFKFEKMSQETYFCVVNFRDLARVIFSEVDSDCVHVLNSLHMMTRSNFTHHTFYCNKLLYKWFQMAYVQNGNKYTSANTHAHTRIHTLHTSILYEYNILCIWQKCSVGILLAKISELLHARSLIQ